MHLFMALALLAATAPEAVVLKPVSNMYAQPSADAEVVSQAIYGANVEWSPRPGWLRIRTADDYQGWVQKADLRALSGEKPYAAAGRWRRWTAFSPNLSRAQCHHAPALIRCRSRRGWKCRGAAGQRALAASAPAGRSRWLGAARRRFVRRASRSRIAAEIELSKTLPGPAVHLGRHVQLRLRLLGVHADAVPAARRAAAARCRHAGRWTGLVPVRARICSRAICCISALRRSHHAHRHVHRRRQIHQRHHLADARWCGSDDLGDPHWTRLLVACRRAEMNRREFCRGAAPAWPAAAGTAGGGAARAALETKIVRLNLRHTWTTTMSSSDFRDTLHVRYTRDGITGHGEGAPIVRYHEDAEGARKAVESVRGLLLAAEPVAVRQGDGAGLRARGRRLGRQGRHRYRADGLGGAEAGRAALPLLRPGSARRAGDHVFHRHRHARDHPAEDARGGRFSGAEDQGGAGHRRSRPSRPCAA